MQLRSIRLKIMQSPCLRLEGNRCRSTRDSDNYVACDDCTSDQILESESMKKTLPRNYTDTSEANAP